MYALSNKHVSKVSFNPEHFSSYGIHDLMGLTSRKSCSCVGSSRLSLLVVLRCGLDSHYAIFDGTVSDVVAILFLLHSVW